MSATSAYKESYAKDAALVSGDEAINENIPYCNKNGFVWGIKVPAGTRHAVEHKAFEEAYPKFSEWQRIMVHSTKAGIWNPMLKKR